MNACTFGQKQGLVLGDKVFRLDGSLVKTKHMDTWIQGLSLSQTKHTQ